MSSGVRILDKENTYISAELKDIIRFIAEDPKLYWSLLYLQAMGDLGPDSSIPVFEQKVVQSLRGVFIDWSELVSLSDRLCQISDITVIGCKDQAKLRRFQTDEEMYRECDLVIVMFDSSYWEVYSKDSDLIDRMEQHFKDTLRLPIC